MRGAVAVLIVGAVADQVAYKPFGTGLSQGQITPTEQTLFTYQVSPNATHAAITHWWITGGASVDKATIRFYMDGEAVSSIALTPSIACGVGFDDTKGPWSNHYFGKGANSGGWFSNFRLPFQRSVNVTFQAGPGEGNDVIYMIVRGAENVPITVGGVTLPTTARMNLQITSGTYPALSYIPIIDAPTGSGVFFMQTLSFSAPNLNTLEGCYHAYTPYSTPYPGFLLSTGTEDYFDSAYYFNAGQFAFENAGFTHIQQSANNVTFSAYRFHDTDPMFFTDGLKVVWRNGDASDPKTGQKCLIEQGGNINGSPGTAQVLAYGWWYSW